MARFTFASGNLGKLLRLPLYALGALVALVVPRSDRLWVFGSGIGVGEGALPLYRAARERLGERVRLVWLASTDRELAAARAAGLDAEPKRGWRGFRLTLRARVLVVTHGFGDVNRYATRGGFVVQLWHGIPLKRLHLDSPAALRVGGLPDHRLVRGMVARAHRWASRGYGLFPVASERVAARVRSAFALDAGRVVVTGDPRDDVLLTGSAAVRRRAARRLVEEAAGALPADARVVLFAPTWRDGAPDPAAPSVAGWTRIAAWLERADAVLLVRSHPLGAGDYAAGPAASDRIRMLGPDRLTEVTPALPAVDVVVTDYSSIAFDAAIADAPTVFLAPDVEAYATRRGLYEPYRAFSGGLDVATWDAALPLIDAALDPASADGDRIRAHARRLRDEHVDPVDGGATGRVLDEILHRVAGGPAPAPAPTRARPLAQPVAFGDEPVLRVRVDERVDAAHLVGPRARVAGALRRDGDGTIAEFPLVGPRWGSPGLALPAGGYRLVLERDGVATSRVRAGDGEAIRHPLFRGDVAGEAGGLTLRVGAPLADDELGARAQRRLERAYRRSRPQPEDAVFLESFFGQSASCNPLGIDRALARSHPGVTRYWSVVDGSVAVPDGAVRIVEGSREWWRVRATARALIVNDWLRKRYRPRPHQRVLQTWHGTMLKRLALDRASTQRPVRGLRTRIAVRRERDRWDALLAQNPYSARIFRSAYAVRGPIWEEGYPRDDVLTDPDAARRVRDRLAVPEGARVVLYAPTWRDDRREMVDDLDVVRFAAELPDDHVVLVRGHSRTLRFGEDLHGVRLLDVSTYPDIADLLTVADVLVTDYSSVMFDFASTGRPMVFFTPDLAHYSEQLRGFYFDLIAEAPGPVTHTRDELRDAVLLSAAGQAEYAERAAAWRERFTPRDDGRAGDRVVARMAAEGWLG